MRANNPEKIAKANNIVHEMKNASEQVKSIDGYKADFGNAMRLRLIYYVYQLVCSIDMLHTNKHLTMKKKLSLWRNLFDRRRTEAS